MLRLSFLRLLDGIYSIAHVLTLPIVRSFSGLRLFCKKPPD